MKLKYITPVAVLGVFSLMASCNKSEHTNHDHSKESAEEHAEYAGENKKDEHADHDHDNHDEDHKDEHAGHDHSAHGDEEHDLATCGVQIGKKGGRVLKKIDGELLFSEDGKLTVFIKEGVTLDKLTLLIDSEPVALTKGENNTYTATTTKDKLPVTLHIAAVVNGQKSVDSFELSLEKCEECSNPEYKCICHNHDH
jgi:hypothetical protein